MRSFVKAVETISEYSGRWSAWIIYVGIIMLTFEVFARYFFNSPTVWAHGYTQRLFGSYFILIGAYTFIHKGHVRIDLIQGKFSGRGAIVFDVINAGFLVMWSGLLMPSLWRFFWKAYQIGEKDEMVLAHPIWWVKGLLFVGMVLICLQGISELVKKIMEIVNFDTASQGQGESN